jgi:hypothetical protein
MMTTKYDNLSSVIPFHLSGYVGASLTTISTRSAIPQAIRAHE